MHLLIALLVSSAADAAGFEWEKTHGWVMLGRRWAGATDREGSIRAIYDLTFPPGFPRARLGVIPARLPSPKELVRAAAALEEAEDGEARPPVLPAAEENFTALEGIGPRQLAALARLAGTRGGLAIRLSDLDWNRLSSGQPEKLAGALRSLGGTLGLGPDWLSRIRLVPLGRDQGVAIELEPAPEAPASEPSRPRRIADLASRTALMWEGLAWDAVDQALTVVTGLIPVPMVSAVLSTVVNRYFKFQEHVVRLHQEMLYEALTRGERGEPSPFGDGVLTAAERGRAMHSLLLAESSLSTVWEWIFRRPRSVWRKRTLREEERATASRAWIYGHGFAVETDLGNAFARTLDPAGALRLSVLARHGGKPRVAIDYAHPARRAAAREAIEVLSGAVDFAASYIPTFGVGTVVSLAYFHAVERPMRVSQRWEARLASVLYEREAQLGESWARELDLLEAQSSNLFDLPRAEAERLADERRRWLRLRESR
jgi:hypothetical protein